MKKLDGITLYFPLNQLLLLKKLAVTPVLFCISFYKFFYSQDPLSLPHQKNFLATSNSHFSILAIIILIKVSTLIEREIHNF